MKNKKIYLQSTSIEKHDLSEDEIEDVLFTFLGRVNEEKTLIAEKRKNKFLELLAELGPIEADKFMTAIAEDKEEVEDITESSPTVGQVVHRFMEIQKINVGVLANKLGTEESNVKDLLNESYRVSEHGMKEIAITIAMRHNIHNQTILRNVLSTGYRFWALKPSPTAPVKLAARKKNK